MQAHMDPRATEANHLQLFYQPKIVLANEDVEEVEVILASDQSTGVTLEARRRVLTEAVRQCGEWLRLGMPLRVAVNVSAREIVEHDLVARLDELLEWHLTPADLVRLEVAELGFMHDLDAARKAMQQLHKLGVHFSIDQYGSGASSLAFIAQLPIDELKIDGAFTSNLNTDSVAGAIARAAADTGHHLGLKVAAQCVDSRDVLSVLQELDCDIAQGAIFTPPLSADRLELWLRDHAQARARRAPRLGQPHDDAWVA